MNTSWSDYSKILEALSSSIFSILFSSIIVAFMAFLIVGLTMVFLRKVILIKRRHIILRILAISYFVLIPIIAFLWGFKYGLANNVESELKKNVSNYTKELDSSFKSGLLATSKILIGNATSKNINYSTNSAIDEFSNSVYNEYSKLLEPDESGKDNFSNKTGKLILRFTKGSGVSFVLKSGIKKLVEDHVGIEQNTTGELMNIKFNQLLDKGLFSQIVTIQIEKFFGGIKKGIIITFFIILLLPSIEIGIAYWWYKKNLIPKTTLP